MVYPPKYMLSFVVAFCYSFARFCATLCGCAHFCRYLHFCLKTELQQNGKEA